MSWVVVAISITLAGFAVWRWARGPLVHRTEVDNIAYLLEVLLHRGFPGGFVVIRDRAKRSGRFIQFSKYISSPGVFGIEFAFPRTGWSEPYYDRLKAILTDQAIGFRLERTNSDRTTEFLNVDCGRDLEQAERVARLTLENVFGFSNDTIVEAFFDNVSVHDELIDGRSKGNGPD
jgi:hypothetical protein